MSRTSKEKLPVDGSGPADETIRRLSIEYQNTRISINESIEHPVSDYNSPDYHAIELEEFFVRYQTASEGLSATDAAARLGMKCLDNEKLFTNTIGS